MFLYQFLSKQCWAHSQYSRILRSCRSRNSSRNPAQDGWRLSSMTSWTFSISIHVFCMIALRMSHCFLTFPNSFAETERSCSCIDDSWIPCNLNSGEDAASFLVFEGSHHFLFGMILLPPISWWLEEPSLLVPFLSSSFTRLTRDPELREESSSLHGLCITRLIGLAFAVSEPSFEVVFCPRFDMAPTTIRSLIWERKLLKWLQEYIDKLIMLNKQRKRFHSSFEKLPVVRMSASWFWVSTYLICILGLNLILSNNQSRATLWTLDTCHIVSLRPWMIILMAASLSKMYNWDSPWKECVFVGAYSTFDNWLTSRFLLSVGVLVLVLLLEGLPGPHQLV